VKLVILIGLSLLAAGCAKDIQNSAAVRQAVLDHLKSRSDFGLNLDAMDIQVSNVSFRDKEADAQVAFVPKGGPAGSGMSMSYKLERSGDKWVVKSKAMTGMGGAPVGGAPGGAPAGSASELPPGHMPTAGGAELPPGHAPVPAPKGNN